MPVLVLNASACGAPPDVVSSAPSMPVGSNGKGVEPVWPPTTALADAERMRTTSVAQALDPLQ
jgi:hypothetical protein